MYISSLLQSSQINSNNVPVDPFFFTLIVEVEYVLKVIPSNLSEEKWMI